jgi:tetratricopeptide (TPR) repeat protein
MKKLPLPSNITDNQILNFIQLAEAEMNAGRYNEAIIFYNNILGINPSLPNIWFDKAIAVFKSSTLGNCRFQESKSFFEKAINISNDPSVNRIISETIIDLATTYFPAYENFFKEHYMAPSSVESLFSTYIEFDKMIFWATEICSDNTLAYQTGYNLCRQITEMPKRYVDQQKWGAFGNEIAGKITKNYGKEVSAKIDRERATEVKNKIEKYSKIIISSAHKYEKGITGIAELKQLIEHYKVVTSKPNVSSEGKSFDDWVKSEKRINTIGLIFGLVLACIGIYNLSDNYWNITFWSVFWLAIGIFFLFTPKWNAPTLDKYSKQQGDLSDWLTKSHEYLLRNNITIELLNNLKSESKNIYQSYYYFNSGIKEDPANIVSKINDLFLKDNATYKITT